MLLWHSFLIIILNNNRGVVSPLRPQSQLAFRLCTFLLYVLHGLLINHLCVSLCQVCWYIQRRWARKHQHWASLNLYKLIINKDVQKTFPNVAIVLKMYLVLMVTNCIAERSFSKLKQIENRLQTSMTQGRLVNLAIMSTESDILREIDFTAIISDCCKIEKGVWFLSASLSGT